MLMLRRASCNQLIRLTGIFVFCLLVTQISSAQSTNMDFPTPVVSDEIRGVIEARDIGDSRLTRHFYLLSATQGDLALRVESNNLNGDVDLFTAGSLRPLVKLSLFSGLGTTSSSKSVFLRRRESLILRVEARSASDEPGNYRVRFSGGFEALASSPVAPETSEPSVSESRTGNRKVRRVNSAGARINEPLPEVAAITDPTENVPPATVDAEKTETETPAAREPSEPAPVKTKTPKPVRRTRAKPQPRRPLEKTTSTGARTHRGTCRKALSCTR